MKLRNKKTGEIKDVQLGNHNDPSDGIIVVYGENGQPREPQAQYSSLAELNEEWEDYNETKDYWYIYTDKPQRGDCGDILEEDFKAIGNYFKTKAEAEKAVEKLKAFKRLKEKGFKFVGDGVGLYTLRYSYDGEWCLIAEDFNLLFGGEE